MLSGKKPQPYSLFFFFTLAFLYAKAKPAKGIVDIVIGDKRFFFTCMLRLGSSVPFNCCFWLCGRRAREKKNLTPFDARHTRVSLVHRD